jgi:capsular exopolysaccharide synthesis family protein
VVVTSSEPGEGKTTVASNFATAVARLEADVLLIDGDLRRPSVARVFNISAEKGLSEVLRDKVSLDDAVRPGPVHGLNLLPTAVDHDAGDLLARKFADVLRQARARFDVVVIDAPPLLGGDDARTLATMCDGVLLVVAAETSATSVTESAAALDTLGVRVLGVVANKLRPTSGASGAYGVYGQTARDAEREQREQRHREPREPTAEQSA